MLLQIQGLDFGYSPENLLFRNFNLGIAPGEIVALAGESGCGKSTLLNLVYGNLDWPSGEISFNGKKLLGPKGNIVPGESEMKFVAQHYDLMPYSTVYDNVGKYLSNINLKEKRQKVEELLAVVGMESFADVKPQFLSGGQQQRVALARALSVAPKLLLLDEPFSNLDFSRKIEIRENLFNYVKSHGISLLISTHEIQEVMPWLDRIVVLQQGRLIQNDTPKETFQNPYNEYVARLFGEVNVFNDNEKAKFGLKKNFYFPSEIKFSNGGYPASILESRFAGTHFWNLVLMEAKKLVVYSEGEVSENRQVSFDL